MHCSRKVQLENDELRQKTESPMHRETSLQLSQLVVAHRKWPLPRLQHSSVQIPPKQSRARRQRLLDNSFTEHNGRVNHTHRSSSAAYLLTTAGGASSPRFDECLNHKYGNFLHQPRARERPQRATQSQQQHGPHVTHSRDGIDQKSCRAVASTSPISLVLSAPNDCIDHHPRPRSLVKPEHTHGRKRKRRPTSRAKPSQAKAEPSQD